MEVKIHRQAEVSAITGLSGPTISRRERAGLFPKRIKISERSSGWRSDEIQRWIEERTAASRTSGAAEVAPAQDMAELGRKSRDTVKDRNETAGQPNTEAPRHRGRPSKNNGAAAPIGI